MAGTTTNYAWDYPTSTDYVKDGATAIQTLATDIDTTLWTALGAAYPGLRLIKKQTIGSAVASVSVTSAFSTTYDAYKVIIAGGVASSTTCDLHLSLTGQATNYYSAYSYVQYNSAVVAAVINNNTTGAFTNAGSGTTNGLSMNCDIINPFLTAPTSFMAFSPQMNAGRASLANSGLNTGATSATGLTIATSTGTITGGTIYVYGYGKS